MVLTRKIKPATFNYRIFITSSLFLLLLTVFSLVWFKKQKDATDLIIHTYEVKLKIEKCFALLLEAETNQRGFLLNNDASFLKNVGRAELQLHANLKQLDSLIIDNSNQLINLKKLQFRVSSRISRLHVVLDSSEQLRNSSVLNFTSPGKIIMDSIRDDVKIMEVAEDDLLKKRTFLKYAQDKKMSLFIILSSVLAFSILIWSFFKIRKESTLRLQAQLDTNLLENLVNERTDQIKNINGLLKSQNEKLERKNLDLISFTHIASHDLKEPLRKIELFTDQFIQLNPGYLTDKSLVYLEKISQQAKRMQSLIGSVLKYAQTDDESLSFEPTDLNDTLRRALETLSEIIKEKNAVIKVQVLPVLICIPEQMEQVFINLIDNALKYSRPGIPPYLAINASRLTESNDSVLPFKPGWKIDFSDNGIGFEDEYKAQIFKIFQRLHTRDEYPGTGFGLAICKKIIENHRGSISSQSAPGRGSVFSIILPLQ